jgi:hypothetical protein
MDEAEYEELTGIESEGAEAGEEKAAEKLNCILDTAAAALDVVVAPSGETLTSLVVNFVQCAIKAGYKENPDRQRSFGTTGPNGKFKEVVRIEWSEARGWHVHLNGGKPHLPIDTPIPPFPGVE